ncbi:MAG: 3-deoxy-D-manno-octulosonic acid kinase [Gammaproteobacteria bacterium]|nr:3-deoxy-D-manno-octulosonic acid kinase [Gammaproteobacteria bacterium]
MSRRIAKQDGSGILYEDTLLSHAEPALFEAGSWTGARLAPGYSGGRGATRFIDYDGQHWVLRHYHRGGSIGRVLDDQFLWSGRDRTRCFREWRLLAHLQNLGLPAPRPVAAHYQRRGLTYTADLITVLIPDVEPLSMRLGQGPLSAAAWAAVGSCIAAFHREQIFHADLTAHNLQIDSADRIFLLDFDRGRIRTGHGGWRAANLARLHRSLAKISRDGATQFTPREWRWLLDGYEGTYEGTGP